MKIFILDEEDNLILNQPEVLLIKEFSDLWEPDRNKCKDDKTGKKRYRATNEFKFIYLVYDWQSPYKEYSEYERVVAAAADAGLAEASLKDPLLKKACRKYIDLQDTRLLSLLRSAYGMTDKLKLFYDTVDLTERDGETGKYVVDHKSALQALGSLGKAIQSIKDLEEDVKKDMEEKSTIKGDAIKGIFDN